MESDCEGMDVIFWMKWMNENIEIKRNIIALGWIMTQKVNGRLFQWEMKIISHNFHGDNHYDSDGHS